MNWVTEIKPEILYSEHKLEKNGYVFKTYIDSCFIIDSLLGVFSYPINKPFSLLNYLKDSNSLLSALLFGGYLGQVHMLDTHLSEFVYFIGKLNSKGSKYNSVSFLDFNKVFHKYLLSKEEYNSLIELQLKDDLEKFFHKRKKSAILLFKSLYNIYPHLWEQRLKYFNDNNDIFNFQINENQIDFIDSINTEFVATFLKGCSKFQLTMPNDLNDAIALEQLFKELKTAKNEIPILLGSWHLNEVVKSSGLRNELSYWNPELNYSIPVVRDINYFINKACFFPPEKIKKSISQKFKGYSYTFPQNDLTEAKQDIIKNRNMIEEYRNHITIKHARKRLLETIESIFSLHFIKSCWLGLLSSDYFLNIVREHVNEPIKCFENPEMARVYVENYLKENQQLKEFNFGLKLSSYLVSCLNIFSNGVEHNKYLNSANQRLERLERIWFLKDFQDLGSKKDSELLNDKITKDIKSEALRLIGITGLCSKEEVIRKEAKKEILNCVYSGVLGSKIDKLKIGLSILWIINEYNTIDNILKYYENHEYLKRNPYPDPSFICFHIFIINQIQRTGYESRILELYNILSKSIKNNNLLINLLSSLELDQSIHHKIIQLEDIRSSLNKNSKSMSININEQNIFGGTQIFSENIKKVSDNIISGVSEEDINSLFLQLKKLKKRQLENIADQIKMIDSSKAAKKDKKISKLKTYLASYGIAVAQNISASALFEILKFLIQI